ncbi:TonB-dependent receptor plug domain-containing protein [Sphingobacterium sp. UT-1RO-CII-1]|uniref:TonB-dependent receptor plug domain-containing protein n=1 Tax=Sphingobacterium sp. UT-1RO-CII-1 TaxID=2995225 RepID=UPI00227CB388|nr:TonB-dependent receptor plug domain-containing protein [Sphingobacterium sp. UT-1RO-CII-1]MCY4779928.1 TonB-dependent receptor plug domain-containing protein [Sphingobacterium sp. UT-1RO-CII-1]
MDSLLVYIIQVNLLLMVLYLGYFILLKNLTFYRLNRLYLLTGVGFSLLYPFLDIPTFFKRPIEPVGELLTYWPSLVLEKEVNKIYTLEHLIFLFFSLGLLFFLARFIMQLFSLWRIHAHSVPNIWRGFSFRDVVFPIVPFSFLNKIYLHKAQHEEEELFDVFKHETIHVQGRHSVDIIVYEILLIACWYNPFVWLMRRAVRQNLEFLTDQRVLDSGLNKELYQYSLLKVSTEGVSLELSNNFNFKQLKKRIMMMNRSRSRKIELGKYAFLLPLVILFAAAFTVSKADEKIVNVVDLVKETELRIKEPVGADTTKQKQNAESIEKERLRKDEVINDVLVEGYKNDNLEVPSQKKALGEVGVMTSDRLVNGKKSAQISFKREENSPLIFIDGKRQLTSLDVYNVNADDLFSVNVYKDKAAYDKYGVDGRNGVIEITTKEKAKRDGLKKVDRLNSDLNDTNVGEGVKISGKGIIVKKGEASVRGVKDTSEVSGRIRILSLNDIANKVKLRGDKLNEKVLFVVDGVEVSNANLSEMDPNTIESISILRDGAAAALYGEKAKDGVILISRNKELKETSSSEEIN